MGKVQNLLKSYLVEITRSYSWERWGETEEESGVESKVDSFPSSSSLFFFCLLGKLPGKFNSSQYRINFSKDGRNDTMSFWVFVVLNVFFFYIQYSIFEIVSFFLMTLLYVQKTGSNYNYFRKIKNETRVWSTRLFFK